MTAYPVPVENPRTAEWGCSEVALLLGCSTEYVRQKARAGIIPHVVLPPIRKDSKRERLRFVPDDVMRWFESLKR